MKILSAILLFLIGTQLVCGQYPTGVTYPTSALPTVTTIAGTSPSANSYRPPYQQSSYPQLQQQAGQNAYPYQMQTGSASPGTGATCSCPTPQPTYPAPSTYNQNYAPTSMNLGGPISSPGRPSLNFGGPTIHYR